MSGSSDISPELAFKQENAERRRAGEPELVLSHELQRKLCEHPGKWVAITPARLIAVGDTPGEALKLAKEKRFKNPILHRVPKKDVRYFFASQAA